MQDGRYDLLHTTAKFIVYTVVIWYNYFVALEKIFVVVSKVTVLDSETMLIVMSYTLLHMSSL